MNRSDFTALTTGIHEDRMSLILKKAADYATEDVLSNFKRMSDTCARLNIAPARSACDCALFLLVLKVDRWCNLRNKGEKPRNESVEETVRDLHNYIDLAYACEKED
jgi:hypothetical protein